MLGAFVAPVALADPADVATTVSGTIERTHVDSLTGARSITVLSTASGPQAVHFAAGEPVPPNGAEVDLHGRIAGDTLEATSATVTGPTIAVPAGSSDASAPLADSTSTPLASGTPRTVAIVVVTFAGGPAPSYTDTQLQNVLTQNTNSVSNYFAEQSYGAVSFTGITNPAGDVFHVSIAADGTGCNSGGWQTWGSEATTAVGSSILGHYDHVIYVVNSQGGCGWAGLGWMPGREVYIDNAFVLSVVSHELGHNLGVHHASSLRCVVGGQNVAFSTSGPACTPSEYGDPFDIMGSSATNQQDAFHKLQSGWLGSVSGPRVQTITASGDYVVSPLELSSGVALLLIPNVTGPVINGSSLGDYFAIDLRQSYGTYFDAFAAGASAISGVQIRLVQTPGGYPIQTMLLDANPQTSTFADAALAPGSTFTDASDQISVQMVGIDPVDKSATVHVTLAGGGTTTTPDTTPPSAVRSLSASIASGPAVTLSFGAATDDRGVAGYRVTRDGTQIAVLGAATTSYTDWSASYGSRTYAVTAVDAASNVGPASSLTAVLVAPTPPPAPPATPPPTGTKTPAGNEPSTPAPLSPGKPAAKLRTTVTGHGKKRRVLLSWRPIAGAKSYTVTRNGHRLKVTRKHTLVDTSPPRGKLHYTVRSTA
jgi:hypothetical protein